MISPWLGISLSWRGTALWVLISPRYIALCAIPFSTWRRMIKLLNPWGRKELVFNGFPHSFEPRGVNKFFPQVCDLSYPYDSLANGGDTPVNRCLDTADWVERFFLPRDWAFEYPIPILFLVEGMSQIRIMLSHATHSKKWGPYTASKPLANGVISLEGTRLCGMFCECKSSHRFLNHKCTGKKLRHMRPC